MNAQFWSIAAYSAFLLLLLSSACFALMKFRTGQWRDHRLAVNKESDEPAQKTSKL
ncbi:hypothetical protein J2736_006021 [Paenibacillus qinlingensis]|uniref:Heme exporter protein D n=1 Tax=Paenibacillus qinlingensis TaxID=1837343 RepID=A0ABU1P4W5_9BACL|nr:hypothetical protein [Paenibacillus qinlingensis]